MLASAFGSRGVTGMTLYSIGNENSAVTLDEQNLFLAKLSTLLKKGFIINVHVV